MEIQLLHAALLLCVPASGIIDDAPSTPSPYAAAPHAPSAAPPNDRPPAAPSANALPNCLFTRLDSPSLVNKQGHALPDPSKVACAFPFAPHVPSPSGISWNSLFSQFFPKLG